MRTALPHASLAPASRLARRGFADCDGNPNNGCETSVKRDQLRRLRCGLRLPERGPPPARRGLHDGDLTGLGATAMDCRAMAARRTPTAAPPTAAPAEPSATPPTARPTATGRLRHHLQRGVWQLRRRFVQRLRDQPQHRSCPLRHVRHSVQLRQRARFLLRRHVPARGPATPATATATAFVERLRVSAHHDDQLR